MSVLRIVGVAELATLALMLLNLATLHLPAVSGVLGPVHGLLYCASVILALLLMNGNHRVWLLSLVPGIGGTLACRELAPRPNRVHPGRRR